jgi:hypothetical protein
VDVENVASVTSVAEIAQTVGENPAASNGEGHLWSPDAADDSLGEGASDDENSQHYFGSSTITICKIKEMVEKGYFMEGEAHAPGTEMVPEPDSNEAVVYEDFFVAGLRMPPHPALADILVKFQAQLHQLTPNAIAQPSKYFWAVGSFGGVHEGNAFAKQYKLHY